MRYEEKRSPQLPMGGVQSIFGSCGDHLTVFYRDVRCDQKVRRP